MKIISKYHDYYDTCLVYGSDPKCVYNRVAKAYESDKSPIKLDEKRGTLSAGISFDRCVWRRSNNNIGVVWFCGQSFPFITISKPVGCVPSRNIFKKEVPDIIYCYSIEELEKALPTVLSKDRVKSYFAKTKRNRYHFDSDTTQERAHKFFNETTFPKERIIESLCKLGVPYFRYDFVKGILTTNPMLKDMQFYKVKDAFTAYQDISMFISGVMGGQSPPMIPISDEVRKSKHGFDEWSFRKKVR
jgi:hypothetical protein